MPPPSTTPSPDGPTAVRVATGDAPPAGPAPAGYRPNRVRGPLNALFFAALDRSLDGLLRPHKLAFFNDVPHTVVELGSGVGANLRYLPAGTRLIAVEPNPAMRPRLTARAAAAGIDLDVHACGAERLDLPDGSAHMVMSSLVLCTVADPERVVAEVRRILRPGGRFVFVEHVAAAEGTALRRIQRAVRRPWAWFFEGCSCERDLRAVIERAGFADTSIESYRLRSPFLPFNTQIGGVAVA